MERIDLERAGAWLAGAAPVLYLALQGGGWDPVVRAQAGIAAWWIVIFGAATGAFPRARLTRAAWAGVALLGAFAVWTAVTATSSPNAEVSVAEIGREAAYLGVLVLAVCVAGPRTAGSMLRGLTAALGVIALLALLSALFPAAFPVQAVDVFFPGSRLSYPLGYADANGEMIALAVPLLLTVGHWARTHPGRGLAYAGVPVAVLAAALTGSRGAVLTATAALLVLLALTPGRIGQLPGLLVAAAGSAVLVAALVGRPLVRDGASGPAADLQRHNLAAITLAVCILVAGAAVFVALLRERWIWPRPDVLSPSRRRTAGLWTATLAAAVLVAVAAGLPGALSRGWRSFKSTSPPPASSVTRLVTVSGSNRYAYWTAAVHALESEPLHGIGPGTFQFYWLAHQPFDEYVRNAHSLYLETLAETGIVGGALIVGLCGLVLVRGCVAAWHADPERRARVAAATAVFAGFATAAAVDWVWQLPAVVAAGLCAAAVVLQDRGGGGVARGSQARAPRATLLAVAVLCVVAIAVPFAAEIALRASQREAGQGRLADALGDALTAQRLEPYAGSPRLQQALVLELAGEYRRAAADARAATDRAPDDYSFWLVRARIEAEAGDLPAARLALVRARRLAPLSPLVAVGMSRYDLSRIGR